MFHEVYIPLPLPCRSLCTYYFCQGGYVFIGIIQSVSLSVSLFVSLSVSLSVSLFVSLFVS